MGAAGDDWVLNKGAGEEEGATGTLRPEGGTDGAQASGVLDCRRNAAIGGVGGGSAISTGSEIPKSGA